MLLHMVEDANPILIKNLRKQILTCLPICSVSKELGQEVFPILLKEGRFRLPSIPHTLRENEAGCSSKLEGDIDRPAETLSLWFDAIGITNVESLQHIQIRMNAKHE